jgi:hypothetical protein
MPKILCNKRPIKKASKMDSKLYEEKDMVTLSV